MVTQYRLLFTTCAWWYVAHRVYVLRRRLSEEVVHSFNQLVLGNSYECQRLEVVNVNMYSVYGSREVNGQYFSLLSCIAPLVFFSLRFLPTLIFTQQKLTVYIHFGPLPILSSYTSVLSLNGLCYWCVASDYGCNYCVMQYVVAIACGPGVAYHDRTCLMCGSLQLHSTQSRLISANMSHSIVG